MLYYSLPLRTLDWWKPGSSCDAVGGQDSSTLPPGLTKESTPEIFIDLMCRKLPFAFEKVSFLTVKFIRHVIVDAYT